MRCNIAATAAVHVARLRRRRQLRQRRTATFASDRDCDGNCHVHANGDSDIYCDGGLRQQLLHCDRTATAFTDAAASADTAWASEQLLVG